MGKMKLIKFPISNYEQTSGGFVWFSQGQRSELL